jgi:5,10-methylenetetrahydromethanopterin reductase
VRISCLFAPTTETPAQIELAESLGYSCAYCYDAPLIGPDVYVTLALAAQRTRVIKLGTGMMIPRLRHVATTAAAFATLNRLAPGRIVMGVGSGFTGSLLLGQRPMRWADITEYVIAVRELLLGNEIIWDGAIVKLVPSPDFEASIPLELPVLIAGEGPKGQQAARQLGAGLCIGNPARGHAPAARDGFSWLASPMFGTVLDDGESPESDRAWAAAGAGVAIVYHAIYESQGAGGLDKLPGGAEFRERIEAVPSERRRHLLHRGHGHAPNQIDSECIPRSMLSSMAIVGTPDEVRQTVTDYAGFGITEVLFNPSGPAIARELERFAQAVGLSDGTATLLGV